MVNIAIPKLSDITSGLGEIEKSILGFATSFLPSLQPLGSGFIVGARPLPTGGIV